MTNNHGHGNRKSQRKNHKANRKVPIQAEAYQMIDGNWTHQPYAYCYRYKGWLTKAMANRHNCESRNCERFETFVDIQLMEFLKKYERKKK